MILLLALVVTACDDPTAVVDEGLRPDTSPMDAATAADASSPDARPIGDAAPPDATPVDAATPANQLPRPVPPTAASLRAPRGWRFARGLIHMHSIHSHDACDGRPKPDGVPDPVCLARLRAAICTNNFDYLLLTDHPDSFADIPFEEAFLHADGDRWIEGEDGPIGNLVACPDGRSVLLAVGSEGDLMPVMFRRKPERPFLRMAEPAGVAGLREAGALVFQAHIERFTADELQPLGLDGMEIYNLHANLDPRGELRQLPEVLPEVLRLVQAGEQGPHTDLAFLAIFRPNPAALEAWDALIGRGARLLGFAGSDIHENLPLPIHPPDGDRIDAYRRLSAWFANYLLVEDVSWEGVRAALEDRRLLVVFDLLGPPDGFDFHAEGPEAALLEMGGEAAFGPGWTLVVDPPVLPEAATMELVLFRVDAEGTHEVLRSAEPIRFAVEQAGSYRVEVVQVPNQLAGELGPDFQSLIRPLTWIYTNPVHLR